MSSATIARVRARYESQALTATCTVKRDTEADDGAGGSITTTADNGTYACRVTANDTSAKEQNQGDRPTSEAEYVLLLPYDADVVAKDRLVSGGITYEVVATDAGRTDALCLTCQCIKRGG